MVNEFISPYSENFAGKTLTLAPNEKFERRLDEAFEERRLLKSFLDIDTNIHLKDCSYRVSKNKLYITLYTEKLDSDLYGPKFEKKIHYLYSHDTQKLLKVMKQFAGTIQLIHEKQYAVLDLKP